MMWQAAPDFTNCQSRIHSFEMDLAYQISIADSQNWSVTTLAYQISEKRCIHLLFSKQLIDRDPHPKSQSQQLDWMIMEPSQPSLNLILLLQLRQCVIRMRYTILLEGHQILILRIFLHQAQIPKFGPWKKVVSMGDRGNLP
ncbi:unnamed protein product [Musa hybrid cultivar]